METKISWLNEMKVGLVEDVSQNIEAGMLKGDIDIGIFHTPVNTNAIHCDILVREFFYWQYRPKMY